MPARRDREGRWRYRKTVKLPDGGRIRISGSPTLNTKQAAEVAEREHIIRVLSPSPAGQTKKEVPTFQKFVDEAERVGADVIALSTLMSTTITATTSKICINPPSV